MNGTPKWNIQWINKRDKTQTGLVVGLLRRFPAEYTDKNEADRLAAQYCLLDIEHHFMSVPAPDDEDDE